MSSNENAFGALALNDNHNSGALTNVTNVKAKANVKDAEAAKRSREAGWVEPAEYDYTSYNAGTREEREAIELTHDLPAWAANAAKYEWSDEYGDVGPAHPELEAMLFRNEFTNRLGVQFSK